MSVFDPPYTLHNRNRCQHTTSSWDEKSVAVIIQLIVNRLTVHYNPSIRAFVPTHLHVAGTLAAIPTFTEANNFFG